MDSRWWDFFSLESVLARTISRLIQAKRPNFSANKPLMIKISAYLLKLVEIYFITMFFYLLASD